MNRNEYLLTKAAEVAQGCTKALTFGIATVQPGQTYTNAERVLHEFADLAGVVDMLLDAGVLPREFFEDKGVDGWAARVEAKKVAVEKFIEHSRACGTIA